VQLTQGRMGVRTRTGWRSYVDPSSTKRAMPGYLDGCVARMPSAARRLHDVTLESRPALQVIKDYGTSPRVLIYEDSPYLGSTRKSGRYKHDMLDDQQHRQLAEALHDARTGVVISEYPSKLYDSLYGGWDRVELPTSTGQHGGRDDRTEVLWSNRPIAGPTLFDLDDLDDLDDLVAADGPDPFPAQP